MRVAIKMKNRLNKWYLIFSGIERNRVCAISLKLQGHKVMEYFREEKDNSGVHPQ